MGHEVFAITIHLKSMANKGKADLAASAQPAPEEVIAAALNEQGYLFHHKVLSVLRMPKQRKRDAHHWEIDAAEVPVSLPNGSETRIDIVLRHGAEQALPWRVVLECKRASRDYKRWVFFAQDDDAPGPSPNQYYYEKANLAGSWNGQGEPNMWHGVEGKVASAECPVFAYGIEARMERPGSNKKYSATEAIEDAFQQVTLGQVGLALKLRSACVLSFQLIPVVLTTAELMSAHFNVSRVSLDRGMIEQKDIKFEARQWLAVNYRVSDVVCQLSRFTTSRTPSIAGHLNARQVRTVFVVQAAHIQPFLAWLEKTFPCAAR
jgi:hypothetical protein